MSFIGYMSRNLSSKFIINTLLATFTIISFTCYFCNKHRFYTSVPLKIPLKNNNQQKLWDSIYTLCKQHSPFFAKIKLIKKVTEKNINENSSFNLEESNNYIHIHPKHIEQMRSIHSSLVASIPVFPGGFIGCGIVMVSGGPYLQAGWLSIRMLRRTNSTIPVEFWMIDETEFNEQLCMGELANIGVTCNVISRVIGSSALNNIRGHVSILRTIKGKHRVFYQTKAIAILLSSFEKVLLMDADNFPIYDPRVLFASRPFIDTGIVAWPDFWRSSVSAHFYNISSLKPPEPFNYSSSYNLSDPHHHILAEANTVESGEIMWNKRTHWKALVLSVYYNIFGPNFYYPLMSLGGPGQGDKETFILAARVLGDDYYFVGNPVTSIGHSTENGKYRSVAMLQANPMHEANREFFFIHANGYKFDTKIFSNIDKSFPSHPNRIWPEFLNDKAGFDIEYFIFQELKYIICESQLQAHYDASVCKKIKYHIFQVF